MNHVIRLVRLVVFGCVAGLVLIGAIYAVALLIPPTASPNYAEDARRAVKDMHIAALVIGAYGPEATKSDDAAIMVSQAVAILDQATDHLFLLVPPPELREHHAALLMRLTECRMIIDKINLTHHLYSSQFADIIRACDVTADAPSS